MIFYAIELSILFMASQLFVTTAEAVGQLFVHRHTNIIHRFHCIH